MKLTPEESVLSHQDESAPNDAAEDIVVGVATHDTAIVDANLGVSPAIQEGAFRLFVEENAPSASVAYNRLLDRSTAPIVIFAHHDVYLPRGWDTLLRKRITELEELDPNWGILAPFGVGHDLVGYGPVWSSSLGDIVGRVALSAVPVQTVDELVIVMRRGAGLRFDESLPGFHLYGTDIVQASLAKGCGAYAMAMPVVHNDKFKGRLDDTFTAAYRHQSRKWRQRLPIYSPTTKISWHAMSLFRSRVMNARSQELRFSLAETTQEDPRKYAALCGWGNLATSDWPLDERL